jgi:hypothetical protein
MSPMSPWNMMSSPQEDDSEAYMPSPDEMAQQMVPVDIAPEQAQMLAAQGIPVQPMPQASQGGKPMSFSQQQQNWMQRGQALTTDLSNKAKESILAQQADIDQLQNHIGEAARQPQKFDFRALAALIDNSTDTNTKLLPAAEAMKPPTQEQRQEKLIQLEAMLNARKNQVTQGNLKLLGDALKAHGMTKPIDPLDQQKKEAQVGMYNRFAPGGAMQNLQADRQQVAGHEKMLNDINKDKTLTQRLSQAQNLDNALALIDKADVVTPQQIEEFQQAIRKNIGIGGTSGVGERESTYIKTLGMNAANVKQFITGNPQDVANNPQIMAHLKDLVAVERRNIADQSQKRLDTITKGKEYIYSKRPDLKRDLVEKVKSAASQYQDSGPSQANEGDTKDYNGATYKLTQGKWVKQ